MQIKSWSLISSFSAVPDTSMLCCRLWHRRPLMLLWAGHSSIIFCSTHENIAWRPSERKEEVGLGSCWLQCWTCRLRSLLLQPFHSNSSISTIFRSFQHFALAIMLKKALALLHYAWLVSAKEWVTPLYKAPSPPQCRQPSTVGPSGCCSADLCQACSNKICYCWPTREKFMPLTPRYFLSWCHLFIEIISYFKIITLRGILFVCFKKNGILFAIRCFVGSLFFCFLYHCGFGFMKIRESKPWRQTTALQTSPNLCQFNSLLANAAQASFKWKVPIMQNYTVVSNKANSPVCWRLESDHQTYFHLCLEMSQTHRIQIQIWHQAPMVWFWWTSGLLYLKHPEEIKGRLQMRPLRHNRASSPGSEPAHTVT